MSPSTETDPRATSVEALRRLLRDFTTAESFDQALAIRPRATDVFVATFPKCGTTLMQQIVHGLRTRGDLDFSDISEVVPWIETATGTGIDIDAEQRAEPRAFKTHLDRKLLKRGGRTIVVMREPLAATLSHWHFFSGWFFVPGTIDFETYAVEFVEPRTGYRDYWEHLVSWWPERESADHLLLCFEDVVADLAGTVERVARFMGIHADEALLEIATRQAHIDFMRQHPTLWDDSVLRSFRNPAIGLPVEFGSTKVREGHAREPKDVVPARVKAKWDERWREVVLPVTGCPDYAAFREAVASLAKPASSLG